MDDDIQVDTSREPFHFTQAQLEEATGPGYWHQETGLTTEQINGWLASQTSVSIIKTETAISAGAGKASDTETAGPWFAVTIWYEPPAPDRERPGFRVG